MTEFDWQNAMREMLVDRASPESVERLIDVIKASRGPREGHHKQLYEITGTSGFGPRGEHGFRFLAWVPDDGPLPTFENAKPVFETQRRKD